ncbi:hypothetical protein DVK44_01870 [Streptomyces paludis]|uniref:Uncharacterized protein n=1 Tax=Streptomyces paludis TaxID=2282738 RepID=A0A345HIV3_9ACTN|nr:hypothetical protein DVK44_01870 [Streptomyces paludis]
MAGSVIAATAALTGAATPAAEVAGARAAAEPKFLAAKDLPPHPTMSWKAGKIVKGLPEDGTFCLGKPSAGKWAAHRDFNTESDTSASQLTIVASDATAARKLAESMEKALKDCAPELVRDTPGSIGGWDDHGKIAVKDGAHAYAVFASHPNSEPSIHAFGVGRSGSTVTVFHWGQMGHLEDVPVTAFKNTTKKAVNSLY